MSRILQSRNLGKWSCDDWRFQGDKISSLHDFKISRFPDYWNLENGKVSKIQDSWFLASWKINKFKISRCLKSWSLEILESWNLEQRKIQDFNNLGILKISRFHDFKIKDFENLPFSRFQPYSLKSFTSSNGFPTRWALTDWTASTHPHVIDAMMVWGYLLAKWVTV